MYLLLVTATHIKYLRLSCSLVTYYQVSFDLPLCWNFINSPTLINPIHALPKKFDWNRIYSLPLISTLGPVCTKTWPGNPWIYCTWRYTEQSQPCNFVPHFSGTAPLQQRGSLGPWGNHTRSILAPSEERWLDTRSWILSFAVKRRTELLTRSGSDLAGLTLNIFVMSSELRCCATSHSLAVMSMRLQMSMSTLLAFSWIFESSSDICCRTE